MEKKCLRNNVNLLIIEDSDLGAQSLRKTLSKYGLNFVFVKDYFGAIIQIDEGIKDKTQKFDIIFMDVVVPSIMSFEQALSIIRKISGYSNTPIIAMDSFLLEGSKQKCLEIGATNWLSKPINHAIFLNIIEEYTGIFKKI